MRVPAGYVVEAVLSPGPTALVALARGPGGEDCLLKTAAIDRAIPMLENEQAVLRALGLAGVVGVPRLLHGWANGFALERLEMPTLREHGEAIRGGHELRQAVARRAFHRLAEVHAAVDTGGTPLRVIHGDVSPDNVFVARDGSEVTLADFGLARWRDWQQPDALLVRGAFRGTLLYAAPEVARGEELDGRADDFSLAASLLHVATGFALRREDASQASTLVDAGTRPLDASHPWRALAPRLFDAVVADALLACLAFDPRDRPRETPRPC